MFRLPYPIHYEYFYPVAAKFDGYLNCSLIRPAKGNNEYVVILKFIDFNSLNKVRAFQRAA